MTIELRRHPGVDNARRCLRNNPLFEFRTWIAIGYVSTWRLPCWFCRVELAKQLLSMAGFESASRRFKGAKCGLRLKHHESCALIEKKFASNWTQRNSKNRCLDYARIPASEPSKQRSQRCSNPSDSQFETGMCRSSRTKPSGRYELNVGRSDLTIESPKYQSRIG